MDRMEALFYFMVLIGMPVTFWIIFLTLAYLKVRGFTMEIDLTTSMIDKIDYQRRLSDISNGNPHALSSIAGSRHKMLNDLLCTVHRDGGQYIEINGYEKATKDAINIISKKVQMDRE